MEKKRWYHYIPSYVLWVLLALLGAWLALLAQQALMGLLAQYYVGDQITRAWRVRFYDKVYALVVGLTWLVITVVTEEYFRMGVARNELLRRFARVAWPEVALLFVADLTLFWLRGGYGWLRWLIIAAEALLSVGLWFIGRTSRKTPVVG
ncbi:MAG TPA: hypothetical protein PKH77_26465 [Anaerolineae bacterium]|nr:hypothetical protein [Anaerolineae bacterium]